MKDNPNLLEDMEATADTMQSLRVEVSVLSDKVATTENTISMLHAQLHEKEQSVKKLESTVTTFSDIHLEVGRTLSVIHDLNDDISKLVVSHEDVLDGIKTIESSNCDDVSIDKKGHDEDIVSSLESISAKLTGSLRIVAAVCTSLHDKSEANRTLEGNLARMDLDFRAAVEAKNTLEKTLEVERQEARENLTMLEKERDSLAANTAVLSEQVQQLERDLLQLEEVNCSVREENDALKKKIEVCNGAAMQQLTASEEEKQELVTENDSLKQQLRESQAATERALNTIKQQEDDLRSARAEIDGLVTIKSAYDELMAESDAMKQTMMALQGQSAQLSSEVKERIAREAELTLHVSDIEAHSSSLEDSNLTLEAAMKRLSEELQNATLHVSKSDKLLEAQIADNESMKEKFRNDMNALTLSSARLEKEKDSLAERIQTLERVSADNSQKEHDLRSEISQLNNQLSASEKSIRLLKQNLDGIETAHRTALHAMQARIDEGLQREEELEGKIEHLDHKLSEGFYHTLEKRYSRLQMEYESLLNKYNDLQGHFKHEMFLSELVKNVESCRGNVSRRRDRWKLPLAATVERWIRFSEQEVVFIISIHLKDTAAAAFNTMSGNEKYAELQPLLDANSSGE